MNISIIKALYKKEILDILRDKKTILMMVVVPLVLYPLIFIGSMYFAQSMLKESTSKTFVVEVGEFEQSDELKAYILDNQNKFDYSFAFFETEEESGIEALKAGKTSAYVDGSLSDNGVMYYSVYVNSSNSSSQTAGDMLSKMLSDYNRTLSKHIIKSVGLEPEKILNPLKYKVENVASNEKTVGNLFGYIVPYLLISSVLMGAMYPAIDVTSGEKERGTLETLLTLPVKNIDVIMSKFLATSTVASATAFLNVFSMGIIGYYMYSVVEITGSISKENGGFNPSLYIPSILLTLVLAIIFAMLSSAVCLSVCIFARSFKEAQNYTTPIMLVFMFAGMAALIPSVQLTGKIILIPVVNFAILISEVFKLEYDFSVIIKVMAVNLSYTLMAIIFMTKVFSSENILFGDGTGGIRIIEKRSEMRENTIPGIGDVILLFSVILILLFSAGTIVVLKYGIFGALVQQLVIGGLPLIYCWYIKTDFKRVFRFKIPKIRYLLGAVFLWIGSFILMEAFSVALSKVFPQSFENADDTVNMLIGNAPFILVVFVVSVLPAICEELAFRGFLFGTLSNRYRIWPSIIISGFIFGAYHGNLIKTFVVGFLGGLMAYVIYKSESIYVSMLMHFLNNFTAIMITYNDNSVISFISSLEEGQLHLWQEALFVLAGLAIFFAGLFIINKRSVMRK